MKKFLLRKYFDTISVDNNVYLPKKICIGLLIVCVVLGGIFRFLAWWQDPIISRDGLVYIQWAEDLQAYGGDFELLSRTFGQYPQSPLFISILACNVGGISPHGIGVTMNIILGSCFSIVVFGILYQISRSPVIGLTGAFFAAIHPTLINYSIELQREMGYLFFAGCFFYCILYEFRHINWYAAAGAGMSAVMAFFFRYEGIELFLFAVIIFVTMFCWKKITLQEIFNHIIIFIVASCLCIGGVLTITGKAPKAWLRDDLKKIEKYIHV